MHFRPSQTQCCTLPVSTAVLARKGGARIGGVRHRRSVNHARRELHACGAPLRTVSRHQERGMAELLDQGLQCPKPLLEVRGFSLLRGNGLLESFTALPNFLTCEPCDFSFEDGSNVGHGPAPAEVDAARVHDAELVALSDLASRVSN
jgi:hypothetical protein